MISLSHEIIAALIICLTVVHLCAISFTFLRLYHRYNISRLWWDDYLAAVAAIVDCGVIIDLWLGFFKSSTSLRVLVFRYEAGFIMVMSVEWTTRIALALAFARIFPPGVKIRHYAISMAILFFCLFIATLTQAFLFCHGAAVWIYTSLVQCDFRGELLYFLVVASILSDASLVVFPLYTLRNLRLPEEERRLIFVCFTGSALVSIACIATTYLQFAPASWGLVRGDLRVVFGYLESGVSLTVCNLLVVVTYLYKVFRQERTTETPAHSRPQGDLHESDRRTSGVNPLHAGDDSSLTHFNFTEISEAYFTQPTST